MNDRLDIFTFFANKPIQFYFPFFGKANTFHNKCESKCLTKSSLNINIDLASRKLCSSMGSEDVSLCWLCTCCIVSINKRIV